MLDIALRFADFAEATLPVVDRMTGATLRVHLLDVIRREAIGRVEDRAGDLAGARDVAVGFVDLAGFTALSEEAAIQEVGSVAGRFERLVADAAEPPAWLVKLLGEARRRGLRPRAAQLGRGALGRPARARRSKRDRCPSSIERSPALLAGRDRGPAG